MNKSPVSLELYNSIIRGYQGIQRDVTSKLQNTWRRSIRDIGGYWIGTAQWEGTTAEMMDIFQSGLMMEIRETTGGMLTWQGFLSEIGFTYKGQRYTRSWADVANKVKVVFSLMGLNLITNNSCEATVWDAYGTPTTREISSTWATKGDYSAHVVGDAAGDGVIIQSTITTVAGYNYQAHVTANIVSGTWRLEIYRADGTIVDYIDTSTVGLSVITVGISDQNLVGGDVGLRLYTVDAGGEIYADAAVFQAIAIRAETGWFQNASSQDEYGTIEYIESQVGMSYVAANALGQQLLNEKAWAKVKPPTAIDTQPERTIEDRLDLTFVGYAFRLKDYYTELGGQENDASEIITDLVGESAFVSAGNIASNTLSYYIEDIDIYRAWDLIREVTLAGDADGNRWTCGVYAERKFYYEQASSFPVARIRGGKILATHGGILEGWLAEPGLVAIDDMPAAYGVGDRPEDKSNMAWMNEVEFDLGEYLQGGDGIIYRQVVAM